MLFPPDHEAVNWREGARSTSASQLHVGIRLLTVNTPQSPTRTTMPGYVVYKEKELHLQGGQAAQYLHFAFLGLSLVAAENSG